MNTEDTPPDTEDSSYLLPPDSLDSSYLSPNLYSSNPDYSYQQIFKGYTNVADSETDVVGIASRELAILLLIVVGLLFVSTVTLYGIKRAFVRFITLPAISLVYGVLAGLIIKLVGVSISEVRTPKIGSCPNVSYNFSDGGLPYYITTEFKNGSNVLKRLYAYSDTLINNETAIVVINKLSEALQFDPEIFFYILLPPIIFFAGYDLKKKHFFRNIGSILMFAFVGTTISAFAVAAIMWLYCQTGMEDGLKEEFIFFECLLFGALISATDPVTVLAIFAELNVDVDLYALIFGESVMNDAVAIVLFESVLSYAPYKNATFSAVGFLSCVGQFCLTFFGSFFIGTTVGLITSMITKLTRLCDFPVMETSLFTLMSYSSFLLSEAAGFTGIVGILFCAITQAHYTSRNLSADSKKRVFELFETLNFLAENFVFSYIGLFLFTYDGHIWRPGFIVCSFLAIGVARIINVFPLSGLLNLGLRQKIPCKFQLMMWWAGLRGAIAFALAAEYSEGEPRRIILTTTLVIVLATVLVNGSATTTVLELLRIRVDPGFERVGIVEDAETDHIINQLARKEIGDEDLHRLQEQTGLGELGWRFLKADYSYLVPLLTIEGSTTEEAFPWCGVVGRWLTSERRADRQESLGEDDVSILDDNYHPVEANEEIVMDPLET
ncbi:hypothetical protein ACHWQZ_G018874 [Mnemiopsis leidyi]